MVRKELLELSSVEIGSLALNEALHQRYFKEYPTSRRSLNTYQRTHRLQRLARVAILCLLILTIFETPLWCRSDDYVTWDYRSSAQKCTVAGGPPASDVIMSGVPFLPHGLSAMIEIVLYSVVLGQTLVSFELHRHFQSVGESYQWKQGMYLHFAVLILGFADAFFIMLRPNSNYRIAPFVRFGLAVEIPWVQKVIVSFLKVTKSIFTIGVFLVGSVVIFAWLAAMIFDDRVSLDSYGDPVNKGFESFGNALYTMFVTLTTANLPDVMVPSFEHDQRYLMFWMPFYLLAVCILMQVVLSVVYSEYQNQITDGLKQGRKERRRGIKMAFQHVKRDCLVEKDSIPQHVVDFDTFVQVVNNMRTFSSMITIDDGLLQVVFAALDADKSGLLTASLRQSAPCEEAGRLRAFSPRLRPARAAVLRAPK